MTPRVALARARGRLVAERRDRGLISQIDTDAALAALDAALPDDARAAAPSPDALPCIGCGVDALGGAGGKVAIYVGDRDIGPWCKRCHAYMQAELADRSEDPDAPVAPDDATLALARFGAMVVNWAHKCRDDDTREALLAFGQSSGVCYGTAGRVLEGARDAIARLLAPDGAVTDG